MILKGIKRLNKYTDSELLGDNEVTELNNYILDGGKAKRRGGILKYNTNSVGGVANDLYDVEDENGNNYVLATAGGSLKKSLNGTDVWSDVKTGLTGTHNRMAIYNGKFYFVNGSDVPFVTNLNTVWNLEITRPDVSSIVTNKYSGGSLTASSRYKWVMVYVTDTGELSPPSQPFTFYLNPGLNDATDGTYQGVVFTSIPSSSDSRVTHKWIFRTQADGDVFYRITSLTNDTTTWTDNYADSSLDTSYAINFLEIPTKASHIVLHKDRLWLGNITKYIRNYIEPETTGAIVSGNEHSMSATADTSSGTLPTGTYIYIAVFVDEEGNESAYSQSAEVSLGSTGRIGIDHLPILAFNGSQGIHSRRLYRSNDHGASYYLLDEDLAYYTGTNITFDDNGSITLGAAYSAPSTKDYKSAIMYSEIGQPATIKATSIIQVFPDDGDEITGLVSVRDGLLIYKKNSICKLYTQGSPQNWILSKIVHTIGCDNSQTIVPVEDKVYFMNNNQVYRFPDRLDVPLSLEYGEISGVNNAAYITSKNWYVLGTDTALYIWDNIVQSWYVFDNTNAIVFPAMKAILEKKIGLDRGKIILGGNSGNKLLLYLSDDNSNQNDYDDDLGTVDATVTPKLTSKMWAIYDKLLRLRRLEANYTSDANVTHTLTNGTLSLTSSDSTTGERDYQKVTDAMTGNLKITDRVQYSIEGAKEFNYMNLETRLKRKYGRVI